MQRRATKLPSYIANLQYSERLKVLKLPNLEHRRKRGEMMYVFKYVNKICNFANLQLTTSLLTIGQPSKSNYPQNKELNNWTYL